MENPQWIRAVPKESRFRLIRKWKKQTARKSYCFSLSLFHSDYPKKIQMIEKVRNKTTSVEPMNFTGEFPEPGILVELTFWLASFCFVKLTKNEFSGNESNSIEPTAVDLNILSFSKLKVNQWISLKYSKMHCWTYTERKIPQFSFQNNIIFLYNTVL